MREILFVCSVFLLCSCSHDSDGPRNYYFSQNESMGSFSIQDHGGDYTMLVSGSSYSGVLCYSSRGEFCISFPSFVVSVPNFEREEGYRWEAGDSQFEIVERKMSMCDGDEGVDIVVERSRGGSLSSRYWYSYACGLRSFSELDEAGDLRVFFVSPRGLFKVDE